MSKLDTLEPDFRPQVDALIEAVQNVTGRKWVCVQGRRTIAEQDALYAQGRAAPGKVITKAPGGFSAHNFGLAADLAPLKEFGGEIDWEAPRSMWQQMADLAQEMGLTAGFYFHTIFDPDHVESPRWKEQQALWKSGHLDVA